MMTVHQRFVNCLVAENMVYEEKVKSLFILENLVP